MKLRKLQQAQRLCRSSQFSWDPCLCKAQYCPIGNLTAKTGHCCVSALCRTKHEQNGELWGVLEGGGGFLGHHKARLHRSTSVNLRKFQRAHCLPTSSQSASHGIVGSAKPSRLGLLGVTLKAVITLHRGSLSQQPTELEAQQKAWGLQGNSIYLERWMRSTGTLG